MATVFENLEAGASIEEIVEQLHVTRNRSGLCSNLQLAAWIRHRLRSLVHVQRCSFALITARRAASRQRLWGTLLLRRENRPCN